MAEHWTLTPEDERTPQHESGGDLFHREIDIVREDGEVHSCAVTVCGETQAEADARAEQLLVGVRTRAPKVEPTGDAPLTKLDLRLYCAERADEAARLIRAANHISSARGRQIYARRYQIFQALRAALKD